MEYKILIEYKTGNSFGYHKTEDYLELTWSNLDIATENLLAIKEHYEMQNDENRDKYKDKEWYVKNSPSYCIRLKSDDGEFWQISCFWLGYFEQLLSVEIKFDSPNMKYDFN
jgi:hypothetical protein